LRERREDIALLAMRFLAIAAEQQRKPVAGIDPATIELLNQYDWPGNVRELRNEVERAVALTRANETITPEHLSARLRPQHPRVNGIPASHPGPGQKRGAQASTVRSPAAPAPAETTDPADEDGKGPLRRARAAFEADYIARVLDQHHGNVSRAAVALGLSRASLQKKMKEYGLR
jgi:DNA-binding NtrC family response regulator